MAGIHVTMLDVSAVVIVQIYCCIQQVFSSKGKKKNVILARSGKIFETSRPQSGRADTPVSELD